MVFGMTAAAMYGNSSIKSANEVALQQQRIARDVMAVQAVVGRLQLAVRDMRLSNSSVAFKAPVEDLEASEIVIYKRLDSLLLALNEPEDRKRIETIKALVKD
jgi:hypothetical protein